MNQNSKTDEDLMLAYQSGEEIAFSELYVRYSSRVYGYIIDKVHDVTWADDAHQLTFLKLHKTRTQYDSKFPFVAWLFTICRSVVGDLLRQRVLRESRETLDIEVLENKVVPIMEEEKLSLEVEGISTLPARDQEILRLRYQKDLDFEEIAQTLNLNSSSVRQIVSRAVRRLRSLGTGEGK